MPEKDFTKVVQIGIIVNNAKVAAENFRNLLGVENWHYNRVDTKSGIGKNFRAHNRSIEAKANIAWTNLGMVEIELIEPLDDSSVYAEHLRVHGPGLHHVMFETADYAHSRFHMAKNGIAEIASGDLQNNRFTLFDMRAQLGLIFEIAEGGALVPDDSDTIS